MARLIAKGVEEARKKAEDVLKQLKAGAKFRGPGQEVFRRPGQRKEGRFARLDRQRPHRPGIREGRVFAGQGRDQRPGAEQLWLPHHSRGRQAGCACEDARRGQRSDRAAIKQQKAAQSCAAKQVNACWLRRAAKAWTRRRRPRGLSVVNTDFVSRTDALPGIGNCPAVHGAVFAAREKSPPDQVQVRRAMPFSRWWPSSRCDADFRRNSQPGGRGIQERASRNPARPEDPGTVRSRQGRARPEEGRQGTGRNNEDQRLRAA